LFLLAVRLAVNKVMIREVIKSRRSNLPGTNLLDTRNLPNEERGMDVSSELAVVKNVPFLILSDIHG